MKLIQHIVAQGDTIQSIAQKQLNDMDKWMEIVSYNDLKYPYIVDTVAEKMTNYNHLVTIGDVLMVKLPEDESVNITEELGRMDRQDVDDIYALALGKDLSVVPIKTEMSRRLYGDEILGLEGDDRGGLKVVQGITNLKQSLLIRMATPLGSYLRHPNFGSEVYKYLGQKNTDENAVLLDYEIERTIRKDGRVRHVMFNSHKISQNSYTASFTVYPITVEEAFEFVLGFEGDGPVILLDEI